MTPLKIIIVYMLVILTAAFSPGLGAESAQKAEFRRDFGFGKLEIFQFKYDTSYLTICDMNRDGLDDILFLNNKASRLEILIRHPSGPGGDEFPQLSERFTDKGFVLDQWVKTFQAADVNGDKRPDIVSIGDQLGLVIYIQGEDGSFGEPVTLHIKDTATIVNLVAEDLDADSFVDLLVCRQGNAEIYRNNGKGKFKSHTLLTLSSGSCQGGVAADINGDRLPDLLFYLGGEINSLRLRKAIGKGKFGWEESLPIPPLRSLRRVFLAEEGIPQLAVILKNGLIMRLYGFEKKEQGPLLDGVEVLPQRLPLAGIGRKDTATWAAADFNKDGYGDFFAAAPLLSQVHLYMGGPSGVHPLPRTFDSLTSIKTIKLTRGGDLAVFSAAEKAIALHRKENPARFPSFLKAPGKPVAMAVDEPGASLIFGIFKDDGFYLNLFNPENPVSGPFQSHPLSITNAPEEIKVFSLDGKNHWMIVFFMAYDRPAAFECRLQDGKLTLTQFQPDRFRALGLSLKGSSVTAVGSQGSPALLVGEGKVARLYRWQNGRFTVDGQLNPRRESARLTAACRFSARENGSVNHKGPGFLVYDELGQDLIWFSDPKLKKKKDPIPLRFRGGLKDIVGLTSLDLKGRSGLLLVGASEVQWFRESAPALTLKTLGEYTSRAERPALWAVFPAVLGSPGRQMLALLDSDNRSIELVGYRNRQLVEELVFEVFQEPGFREPTGGYEPHSFGTGDINGDNIRDMIVLVHDKLIVYLGE